MLPQELNWNIDTSILHRYGSEKEEYLELFFESPDAVYGIFFYDLAAYSLNNYAGKFAVFTNKEAPRLICNPANKNVYYKPGIKEPFYLDTSGVLTLTIVTESKDGTPNLSYSLFDLHNACCTSLNEKPLLAGSLSDLFGYLSEVNSAAHLPLQEYAFSWEACH